MGTKVDMSLEDIIKTNKIKPGNRRGGGAGGGRGAGGGMRGRGRGMRRGGGVGVGRGAGRQTGGQGQRQMGGNRQNFGQRGNVNARWNHDMYQGSGGGGGGGGGGGARTQMVMGTSKLLISNLDFGVSDSDIHELFAEFGTTRNAAVHYDRSGRSLGTAHVVFERHHDALKAIKQYNGVHLDGRPMNITMEGGNRGQQQSIAPVKRLSQGPRPFGGGFGGGRGGRGGMRGNTRGNRGTGTSTRGNTRGTRGTRGVGGRGRGRGGQTKPPTAEELDAELDAYVNQVNK